jgi:hypothetical protein
MRLKPLNPIVPLGIPLLSVDNSLDLNVLLPKVISMGNIDVGKVPCRRRKYCNHNGEVPAIARTSERIDNLNFILYSPDERFGPPVSVQFYKYVCADPI